MSGPVAQQLSKEAAWARLYTFDFSEANEVAEMSEQIVSATVTCPNNDGALRIGTPLLTASSVQVLISGGTAGLTYQLVCSVNFSGNPSGQTVDLDALLEVDA